MNIIYKENTLFVDLEGSIDINCLKIKLFSILNEYKIKNIVIETTEVFNYKKNTFKKLKEEYKKIYKGNLKILR